MMGLHPTSVTTDWKQQLYIYNELTAVIILPVGEWCGLYWDKSLQTEQ